MNYFLAQAMNNQWANYRLLQACAGLNAAEYAAPRVGFFPSIQATLCHILDVDLYYLAALKGDLEEQLRPSVNASAFLELANNQAQADRRLVALCSALSQSGLAQPVRLVRQAGIKIERADRVLLHLFEHQIHHRGQVHGMLSETPVAPPQLDEFFLEQDAPLRASEVSALGIDEAAVWAGK
ncbi:DinB family protein [Pseudomonas sp. Marseille-Q5115]|uniref:DinB family protein n=1 Tax=Pseudomonas sp. Marseille-Q5115 TaxID=2866593 RepID=UPI001CE3FBAD|nr:DinB family protein [Pseudomonas sp. Marseille-Q5115]